MAEADSDSGRVSGLGPAARLAFRFSDTRGRRLGGFL